MRHRPHALAAVLAGAILLGLAPSSVAEPDLVARWPVDEIVSGSPSYTPDSGGGAHHGVATPGGAFGPLVPGRFGNAMSTPGNLNGFRVPVAIALEPPQLTVMAWVKKGQPFHVYRQIVMKGGKDCGAQASTWALDTGPNGSLRWSMDVLASPGGEAILNTAPDAVTPEQIWDDQWHAIAGTWDGHTAALWLDGVKIATAVPPFTAEARPVYGGRTGHADDISVGHFSQQENFDSGGSCDPPGFQFYGAVDDVRLYNRALTDAELRYLQRAGTTSPPELPLPPDLVEPPTPPDPENTVRPTIKESAGGTFTCDPGTWSNLPSPPGFTYRWVAMVGSQAKEVSAAQDYKPTAANFGYSHYCEVRVRGPRGVASAVSGQAFFTSAGLNKLPAAYGDVRIRGIDVFQVVQPVAKAQMFGFPGSQPFPVTCGGGTPTNYRESFVRIGPVEIVAGCVLENRAAQRVTYQGVFLDRDKSTTAIVYVDTADVPVTDRNLDFDVVLSASRDGNSVGEPLVGSVTDPPVSHTPYVEPFERIDQRYGVQFRLPSGWTSPGGSLQFRALIRFPSAAFGEERYGTRQCDVPNCDANDSFTLDSVNLLRFPVVKLAPIELRRQKDGQAALRDPGDVMAVARRVFPGGSRMSIPDYKADLDITDASKVLVKEITLPFPPFDKTRLCTGTGAAVLIAPTITTRDCRWAAVEEIIRGWITDNPARPPGTHTQAYDAVLAVHDYQTPFSSPTDIGSEPGWQHPVGTNLADVSKTKPTTVDETPLLALNARERPLTAASHELGHFLTLPHAGSADNCRTTQLLEDWLPDHRGRLQSVRFNRPASRSIFELFFPPPGKLDVDGTYFDATGTAVTPELYDLMSYCADASETDANFKNSWLSARNWNHVAVLMRSFGKRVGLGSRALRLGAPTAEAAATPSARAFAIGSAGPQGGEIREVVPADGADGVPAAVPSSPYKLRSLGANGAVLLEAGVDVQFPTDISSPIGSFVGPVAANASAVELTHNGTLLHRLGRSRPPRVTLTAPGPATHVRAGRSLQVRWRASDPDTATLKATLDYSPDGGRSWRSVAQLPSSGRVTIPARLLPGSRRGRVRVSVRDGFNEATATSRAFRVDGSPPQVTILTPQPGDALRAGDRTLLTATAQDDLGRAVSGRRLTWFARGRRLGSGARLRARLPAGRITLTLVARSTNGRSGTARARLRVASPQLRVVRASIPQKVGRGARSVSIRLSTSAPATLSVAGRRLRVGTRTTKLSIPLPRRPAVGLLRVPFRLSARSRAVKGTIRGAVSVVRT